MFGTEIKDAIDDPERLEAIAEANKEYVERVAESKKLDEEYQANLADSLANWMTFSHAMVLVMKTSTRQWNTL